ncbi:MAG TPA: MerR family transcriptional regulator [Candidatus Limnocylindrales bacterium]|nr:MerR family transcriptional regulator [Candidatus Limnocylindrales bacterium]
MYTIKQAAQRSGLPVATVRAWERRYGVVEPARTAAGYRLYDDQAIARLTAMRHLVERRGLRPGQAAVELRSGIDITGLVGGFLPYPDVAGSASEVDGPLDPSAFVDAASRLDLPAMERMLDEWFAAERFEAAVEHAVFPALRAIGAAWTTGQLDPGMEHAASETIRRRIAHFFDAAAVTGGQGPIVVGLPPGAQHDIGALAFATAARRAGISVVYLGPNVPLESWLTAVRTTGARVAVVGAIGASDVAPATGVVAALGRMDEPPSVVLGGPHAPEVTDGRGAVLLPPALEDAVAVVRGLAGRTA